MSGQTEERRKENWIEGCHICGGKLEAAAIGIKRGQVHCSLNEEHAHADRRRSAKCACGKWKCSGPPHCNHFRIIGSHHTDGTTACETNYRSPTEQETWIADHVRWKAAQAKLPDLAAAMALLDDAANPLSFDSYDIFMFVESRPEEAAICLSKMYKTLSCISIGKEAMEEIPTLKRR